MNALRTLFAATVIAVASTAARADILIDDFSAPSPVISYYIPGNSLVGSNPNPSTFTTNSVQPGVNRSITLTVTSSPTQFDSLTGSIGGGLFSMSLNGTSSGTAVLNYTFSSAMNFIPNVSAGGSYGALQYKALADLGFGIVPLGFTISTTTGNLVFNTSLPTLSTPTAQSVSLSSFTGTGDLTQVTGLSIAITAGQAADLELEGISVTTPPPPESVPAPPAALLALLALPALGLRNRGGKKAIAVE